MEFISVVEALSMLIKVYKEINSLWKGYVDDEELKVGFLEVMLENAMKAVKTKDPKMEAKLEDQVRKHINRIQVNLEDIRQKMGRSRMQQLKFPGTKVQVKQKLKATKELAQQLGDLLRDVERDAEPGVILHKFDARSSQSATDDEEESVKQLQELFKELSNPGNTKPVSRSELEALKAQGIFTSVEESETLPGKSQLEAGVSADGFWFEERIPLASDRQRTKQRRDRLLRLMHILQRNDVINIARPCKLLLTPKWFVLRSRSRGEYLLGDRFGHIGIHEADGHRLRLMLAVTQAIHSMHLLSLVHKALHCFHVVVDERFQAVQLLGFISARVLIARSDTVQAAEEDRVEARRGRLYQAPERQQADQASYSFPCDIFSLGVLLLEIFVGKCFFYADSIQGLEDILEVARTDRWLKSSANPLGQLILDCLQKNAPDRPTAFEILQILESGDCLFPEAPAPEV